MLDFFKRIEPPNDVRRIGFVIIQALTAKTPNVVFSFRWSFHPKTENLLQPNIDSLL